MNRDSVDWHGYIPAVTTPFTAQGDLDRRGWQQLLDWLVAEGMHGLAVAGTTGEWFSLSAQERKELFALAASQVNGRIPLLAGCTAFTPGEAIEYARAALEEGFDGILVTPPPYVVPNNREIVAFYSAISDAVRIPICVYNWPPGTNVDLATGILGELAQIENVVAIKNSTGDFGALVEGLLAVGGEVRYFGVPMNEIGITLVRAHHADGTIGAGAVLGSDHPNFFNRLWADDLDGALRCGARDRLLFARWINRDYSPRFGSPQAILKTALNLRGLPGGYPRPPLLPLTEAEVDLVRDTLGELGLVPVPA